MIGSTNAGGGGGKCFAFINVTYPSGSTCTCTSSSATGSKVLKTKGTSGSWAFRVPFADTWTVAITDASHTTPVTKSVVISTEGQSNSITISYFPDGYTRIEYLESLNGNAYINPSYTATATETVVVDFMAYATGNAIAFGAGSTWVCGCYNTSGVWNTSLGFSYDKAYATNSRTVATGKLTGTNKVPYFFATKGTSGANYYLKGRIYDITITDGSTLVHHYVPCIRNSDSKLGVLDIVNETSPVFYAGSGTFTAGGNV